MPSRPRSWLSSLCCHAEQGTLEKFAVDEVEDRYEHDLTPLVPIVATVAALCFRSASRQAKMVSCACSGSRNRDGTGTTDCHRPPFSRHSSSGDLRGGFCEGRIPKGPV